MDVAFWIYVIFFCIFSVLIMGYVCILLGNYCYTEGWPAYRILYFIYRGVFILCNKLPRLKKGQKNCHRPSVALNKKESIKNEYWLYRKSTLTSLGRASFLYFLIVCLFLLRPYIHSSNPEGNIDDLIKGFQLFMVITIPFFTYGILFNNFLIYSPAEEINDFLRIFCKAVLLLKRGEKILQKESGAASLGHIGNARFTYIKTELDNILNYIEKEKYLQPKELGFILNPLQSTIQQFMECASADSHSPVDKNPLMEFDKQYTRLHLIYKYFLKEKWTATYTKYFFSTYLDIGEIRGNFSRITRATQKEIEQMLRFIE